MTQAVAVGADMGANLSAVDLGLGGSAIAVSAGYYHTCALLVRWAGVRDDVRTAPVTPTDKAGDRCMALDTKLPACCTIHAEACSPEAGRRARQVLGVERPRTARVRRLAISR